MRRGRRGGEAAASQVAQGFFQWKVGSWAREGEKQQTQKIHKPLYGIVILM
ncbi:hypothetical protein [Laspinema olomoucense]|uniref:Uncharacterized protein n=1 Tax=Laspinema olomoucense D3b TaxID=2953688 RepID=A0ABT2NAU3_9CYAN|nr:hypothetical protein [Laspinema sp. D3b]MCT7979818.1 hypothetical protein [Laspinema sp. D3b]